MSSPAINLNSLRVATPCPISWEQMRGDDRVRFCGHCKLHVYNISAMTTRETQELITRNEGRLCGRLYRRADGTVITKDCPVGLSALRKTVSKKVAAVFAAVFSLCFNVTAQQSSQKADKSWDSQTKITRKVAGRTERAQTISGVVVDPAGAGIPGATIQITNAKTGETQKTTSNDEGRFTIASVVEGDYLMKVEAIAFKPHQIKNVRVSKDELLKIEATLQFQSDTFILGLLDVGPSLIDRPLGTTIMSGEHLRKLPF